LILVRGREPLERVAERRVLLPLAT
jgi:hypothetical protein